MSDIEEIKSNISSSETPPPKKPKLIWSDTTEELLVSWCDIARCYTWLHEKSFRKYNRSHYNFSIPIIILSTLAGTASIGINGYVPPEHVNMAQLAVGAVNILTGIITTFQNFFRYAQNSESHLNASTGWSKLYRNIKIELSLERSKRKDANEFVKISRAEYDRLMEQSPIIPDDVIDKFKTTIKIDPTMVLPDIVDTVGHTKIHRNIEEEVDINVIDEKKTIHSDIKNTISSVRNGVNSTLNSRLRPISENSRSENNRHVILDIDNNSPPPLLRTPTLANVNRPSVKELIDKMDKKFTPDRQRGSSIGKINEKSTNLDEKKSFVENIILDKKDQKDEKNGIRNGVVSQLRTFFKHNSETKTNLNLDLSQPATATEQQPATATEQQPAVATTQQPATTTEQQPATIIEQN